MKKYWKSIVAFSVLGITLLVAGILMFLDRKTDVETKDNTQIILYGEAHGLKDFYDVEFSEWKKLYDEGNRYLFVELPYYTAQYLNEWMRESDDAILDQIFEDIKGTASGVDSYKELFVRIKNECPGTIFFGTDVGHQYDVTGARYIADLEEKGLVGTVEYEKAIKCIEQGKRFRSEGSNNGYSPYRESCMIENFIEAYDNVSPSVVMGIYGSFHTDTTNSGNMYAGLKSHFGDVISSQNISNRFTVVKPYSFGFSYIGLIFLLMLFIPNGIWSKYPPKNYEMYSKGEPKALTICERIGQVLVTVTVLVFKDFNFHIFKIGTGVSFSFNIIILITAIILMVMYDISWILYFRSPRRMLDFYRSFCGFPLSLATLPVLAFFLLGIYGQNLILIVASILLGIGHIGIHQQYHDRVLADMKKRR